MGKRIDWEQVDELVEKIKEKGLSLAEGARQFDIPIRRLYEFNRRQKQTGGKSGPGPEASDGQAKKADAPPGGARGRPRHGGQRCQSF